jgi:hypothetical protein
MAVASLAESRIGPICESIDRLISTEIEAKPGDSRGMILKLYEAARAQTDKPLVQGAAEALLEAIRGGGPVIVSSGWVIDFWYSKGELCGMIGGVALARAISQGLKTQVSFLTEEPALSVFNAAARAVGTKVFPYERLSELPHVVTARSFPIDPREAEAEATRMLDELKPAAIITVEKCSPNKKGVHHTGRGTDMSPTTAKVDVLVRKAQERGILTIGIGDLGNEIGFGKILADVEQHLPKGADCGCPCGGGIASDLATDHLIVAASSNRGGYGLVAALGTLVGDVSLMPTGAEDTRMIQAAAFEGACDSFTTSPTPTDGHGMPAEFSAHFIELLRYQIMSRDIDYPLFGARA